MATYQVETDNGTFQIETDNQSAPETSLKDKVLSGAKTVFDMSPPGMMMKEADFAQKGLDTLGEKAATGLAEKFPNLPPQVPAALGTAISVGPSMAAGAMMPAEAAAPKLAEEASPIANKLSQVATDARMRGFNIPGSAVDQAGELNSMRDSVNTLKGLGVEPKMFQSAEDLGNEVKQGISEYGQAVREIPKALDSNGITPRLNPDTLSEHLRSALSPTHTGGAYDAEAKIAEEIADTAKDHSGSFQDLLDLKQKLGEQGKFYRVNTGEPNAPLKASMYQKAYGEVANIITNEINQQAPQVGDAWIQANKNYSAGKDVIPSLTKAAGKEATTDFTGFSTQHPLQAVKGLANRSVALGADALSKIVQTGSDAMGKFAPMLKQAAAQGPKEFAVAHYTMSQRDPEYRKMLEGLTNEDQ